MFGLDVVCVRPLRFSLSLLALTSSCLLPIAAQAQSYGSLSACNAMTLGTTAVEAGGTVGGNLNGFVPFSSTDMWNTNIASAPIDPNSAALITAIGTGKYLTANFGTVTNPATGIPYRGTPYTVVDSSVTPSQSIYVYGSDEQYSDVVVAPFPNTPGGVPIGGSPTVTDLGGNLDCTGWPNTPTDPALALVLDRNTCWLYETYGTTSCNGEYNATQMTIWDMVNDESRPWGWPSSDGSGLPVFPGLARYDEAQGGAGAINHALAFTMPSVAGDSNNGYFVLPASYANSTNATANLMPMGTRLQLKPSISLTAWAADPQPLAILTALQQYGMILTDVGTALYLEGVPDARWNAAQFLVMDVSFPASDFQVVDPPFDSTTEYTMSPQYPGMDAISAYTATNPEYSLTTPVAPVINSFTAVDNNSNPLTNVQSGDQITFNFNVSGDSYDYIDNIGPQRLTANGGGPGENTGSVSIYPSATQEYTLYSTNSWGRVSSTIQITMPSTVVTPPVFDPSPAQTGVLTAARSIAMSTPTSPNATIYYTLSNGTVATTPTTNSTTYTGPISVDSAAATQTLAAIAVVSGYSAPSAVSSATYIYGSAAVTPTFNPAAGSYSTTQTVTISTSTSPASIYYTTDGTTPTYPATGSTQLYTTAISVGVPETLKAIALSSTTGTSAVGSAAYTFKVPTPVFTPNAGTYTTIQTVTISDANAGATIYYVTNGGIPTTASPIYSTPITVSSTQTLRAIAEETGYTNSAYGSAIYTINLPTAPTPAFSPAPGTYSTTQTVTISDGTSGATIYYTTDGSTPTTASVLNGVTPVNITVSSTTTLNALAVAYNYLNSTVGSAVYTLQATTPTFSPAAGTYSSTQTVTISDSTASSTIYYTTDGSTPTTTSPAYSAPLTVSSTETLKAIAAAGTLANSTVGSALYAIQAATPGFSPGAGTYTTVQTVTISDATGSATIYYTTDGTTPTTSSTQYSSAITVSATQTLSAIATAAGIGNSAVGTAAYTINLPPAATPAFSPVAGTYGSTQSVTISDATASPTIYYTTDGSTPTTSSPTYSTAISVSANETIQAIATATGYSTSTTGTAVYTIQAATPGFSPVAGSYGSAQSVTISDATGSSTIYYTTNGTTPTTTSPTYSAAIPVSANETIEAIATAAGYGTSATGSAAYTIAAATPGFSPIAGTYTTIQTVTISDSTGGATIYYTTDGSTPSTTSPQYSGGITVSASETIQAIATASGYGPSAVGSVIYTINLAAAATPTFSPVAGTYGSAQSVTISDATGSSTIYYTTNGSTPTTTSPTYSAAIPVSANETIEAIATANGYSTSATGTAVYTIQAATPGFSPAAGTYTTIQTVTISDSTGSSTIYYTTDGSTPSTTSPQYSGGITVSASETIQAIATASGYGTSAVGSAIYTINLTAAATPGFSPIAGSYGSAQSVTISDATGSSTIYYTTNGTTPTTTSPTYSAAIPVSANETIEAIATANGYSTSGIGSAAYTIAAATPTFSPVAGSYSTTQTVTISDTTGGATIYYTTNGSTPSTSSPQYSGGITVSASETIQAIATASGYGPSAVGSAAYTISLSPAATPGFTPAAGSYGSAQSVTISDATGSSTIYYTTNGSTPTTTSPTYSAAIPVSANETIEAIATASGYSTSGTGSAAYTIATVTPTFSPVAGTYGSAQSVTISDASGGATIYYTTNGSTPTTSSSVYSVAITVSGAETVKAIALAGGYGPSAVASAAYATSSGAPVFSPGTGSYYGSQSVTISDASGGTTVYYTTNATTPTTNSATYVGPITVSATETLEAIAAISGSPSSSVASAFYTIETPAALTTPTPNTSTPLTGTSVAFSWTPGNTATHFEFWVGTSGPGSTNLYNSGSVTATTETVSGLPTNGETVYARLYWLIGGTWREADYTYVSYGLPTKAVLTTPAPNTPTPLSGSSVAFSWTPSNIVTHYEFWMGTSGAGSSNLYNSGSVTATTETVNDLPSNGDTVNARLYTLINGAWQYTDYTYKTSGSPIAAALTTPTPDTLTPLSGTSVAFAWNPGNVATQFQLRVGTLGVGSSDLYNSGPVTATTETVSDLPNNDSTVYVRFYSLVNGTWKESDYTYISAGAVTQATLTTPAPNTSTPLSGTSVAFSWSPGNSATHFELYVGTSMGSSNLYNSGNVTATTETVFGLPSNGQMVYVRLYSLLKGAWKYTDYTYVATGSPTQAALTTPTPNTLTPLTGANVTFSWTPGNTATHFILYLGSTAGSSNLYNSGNVTATSANVTGLPVNGATIYARLYSLIDGAWQYTNYTYKAY